MSNNRSTYNLRSRNSTGAVRRNSQANARRQNVANPPHLNAAAMNNGSGRTLRSSSRLRNNAPYIGAPINRNAAAIIAQRNRRHEEVRADLFRIRMQNLEDNSYVPRSPDIILAPQTNGHQQARLVLFIPRPGLNTFQRVVPAPSQPDRPRQVPREYLHLLLPTIDQEPLETIFMWNTPPIRIPQHLVLGGLSGNIRHVLSVHILNYNTTYFEVFDELLQEDTEYLLEDMANNILQFLADRRIAQAHERVRAYAREQHGHEL